MRKQLISVVSIVMLGLGLQAQVNLDSCRSWARANFPFSQQYGLVARSEALNIQNASMMWIPRLALSAQATWQNDVVSIKMADVFSGLPSFLSPLFPEMEDMSMGRWQGKVQLDLVQPLWDGGVSSAQKKMAHQDAAVQVAQADVEMRQLEDRVDQIFFGILLLEEQNLQLQSHIELLQSNLERAKVLVNNEVILSSDANAVEAELLTVQQRQSQLTYGLKTYRQMLSLLCGKNLENEKLEEPKLIEDPMQVRPMKNLFATQKEALSVKRKALTAFTMPRFAAFAQGWYGYPKLNMFESMKNTDLGFSAVVGVQMRWDISSLYTLKNDRRKIDLATQQIAMQEDVFDFNDSLQMTQDELEVQRLRDVMKGDQHIVDLRTNVRQAAEVQFENGTITTSDLLKSMNEETQARCEMALHEVELQKKISEMIRKK